MYLGQNLRIEENEVSDLHKIQSDIKREIRDSFEFHESLLEQTKEINLKIFKIHSITFFWFFSLNI